MKYGWKRDLPDHRDQNFAFNPTITQQLPPKVSLIDKCPDVYDQSSLGSCTANSGGGLVHYLELKENFASPYVPSRLFIYYYERLIEHTVPYDAGAALRDCMKVLVNLGAPHENLCPYIIQNFAQTPSMACYQDALKHKVSQYNSVRQDLNTMKATLADSNPIIGGFTVYQSFESQQVTTTGIVPMPSNNERVLGGHAVMLVGYDDATQMFDVRNSWGKLWGINGYCKMPYAYWTNPNLASDFWTAKLVK